MPTLRNAPIVEAVFDVRVDFQSTPSPSVLESLHDEIRDDFPIKEVNTLFQGTFGIDRGQVVAGASGVPNGFSFKTADLLRIVQVRADGFTFNKLKPYDNWANFRDEARRHWERYLKFARPTRIKRVALRFINRFEIPASTVSLSDYLAISPRVPNNASDSLRTYFLRLELDSSVATRKTIVTSTIDQGNESPKRTTLILDVDAFELLDTTPGDPSLWTAFETLREQKNSAFFGSLTERGIALFN